MIKFNTKNNVNIIYVNSIDSTNDKAKEMALKGAATGTVICAEAQSRGKGRMGRRFLSEAGKGIYLSLIINAEDTIKEEFLAMTSKVAIAVKRSVKELLDINLGIKWVNDLMLENKKVGGILIEAIADKGGIKAYVIGIGLNCYIQDFSPELKNTATYLEKSAGFFDKKALEKIIIDNVFNLCTKNIDMQENRSLLDEYKKSSIVLDQYIDVLNYRGEIIYKRAKVIDFTQKGELIIKIHDGSTEIISSGEISLRNVTKY